MQMLRWKLDSAWRYVSFRSGMGKTREEDWIYFQHEKPIMREESLRP